MNKMTKEERDRFVQTNYCNTTNKKMAEITGWSETTIKSVKRRLGLVNRSKSPKLVELEKYCVENYDGYKVTDKTIAEKFGCKADNVRDTLKALNLYKSPGDKSFDLIKRKYSNKFLILSEYKGADSGMKLQCKTCGTVHVKRTNTLVSLNFSCNICNDKYWSGVSDNERVRKAITRGSSVTRKPSTRENCIDSILSLGYSINRGIIKDATSKVHVTCPNGHERHGSVRNILRYNCAECKNINNNYSLYILKSEFGYKIGVTTNIEHRVSRIKASCGFEIQPEYVSREVSRNIAYYWEKKFHEMFKDKNIKFDAKFDGSTEFFNLSPEDLNLVKNHPLEFKNYW